MNFFVWYLASAHTEMKAARSVGAVGPGSEGAFPWTLHWPKLVTLFTTSNAWGTGTFSAACNSLCNLALSGQLVEITVY